MASLSQEHSESERDANNLLLSIHDLHVVFDTYHGVVHALSGVNLNLYNSKITGLVGETGCGKSVTARSIIRLISKPGRIVSGKIELDGRNMLHISESEMQDIRGKIIAMIFQNPRAALNPVFTVEDQMHFLLERHKGFSRAESRPKMLECLQEVGIAGPETRLKNYPFELSTGMCQRIMIAMALSCSPKLLIADEPTTGVDVTIQAQILELFSNLIHDHGSGALIITHDLGVVAETCDYAAVMYAGKVVEYGVTQEVFHKPLHPYTQGLLKSSFTSERTQKLHYIPGEIPDLINLPAGCAFAPRCVAQEMICRSDQPAEVVFEKSHMVRCFAAEALRKEEDWSRYEKTG